MSENKPNSCNQILYERCRNMSARQCQRNVQSEDYTSPTLKFAQRLKLARVKSVSFEKRQFKSPKIVRAKHDFFEFHNSTTKAVSKTADEVFPSLVLNRQKRMIDPNLLLDKPALKKPYKQEVKKYKLFIMNMPLFV